MTDVELLDGAAVKLQTNSGRSPSACIHCDTFKGQFQHEEEVVLIGSNWTGFSGRTIFSSAAVMAAVNKLN